MTDADISKNFTYNSRGSLAEIGRRLNQIGSPNIMEEKFSWGHLSHCEKILDVACGIGRFMSVNPQKVIGIDINEDSVSYCKALGFDARLGNALDLAFEANSFDGVHSAHVMHALNSSQATRYLAELIRVTRPGGTIIISNLCDPREIFIHPEVSRPYPPEALYRMIHASSSPRSRLGTEVGGVTFKDIHFRRPPLLNFRFVRSERMWHAASVLNSLQFFCGLRKFWAYQGYTLVLTKNTGPRG